MALKFFSRDHARTPFVKLDTRKCKACWRCIDKCSNQVIGKVDLPWHKHVLLVDSHKCNGCLTCIQTCSFQAFSMYDKENRPVVSVDKRLCRTFIINNLLLISGIVMIISGLILQVGFHIGGGDNRMDRHLADAQTASYEQMRSIDQNKTIWTFHYYDWSTIHKIAIVLFLLLMVYHAYVHWKWYKGVFEKRLFSKNLQILTLSLIFILIAITGIVPWFIDLSGGTSVLRLIFIEIHDKLALIFLIYLVLHIAKRSRWYSATYLRIR